MFYAWVIPYTTTVHIRINANANPSKYGSYDAYVSRATHSTATQKQSDTTQSGATVASPHGSSNNHTN
ncbi:9406_t:CDS:2 [Paraglomus occultum]|uniref:9406_t:CDS:1 n=1 Tax=Paraglomus occultum TaxID=144539 RepID=A0A9N8VGB4_9GLOM|nr:9406_t:CDS:2 [Paraglomus occultum]